MKKQPFLISSILLVALFFTGCGSNRTNTTNNGTTNTSSTTANSAITDDSAATTSSATAVEATTTDMNATVTQGNHTGNTTENGTDNNAGNNTKNNSGTTTKGSTNKEKITENKAKEIALAKVPGAKESDIIKFETDYDDGQFEYDIKIHYNGTEYEFEIDGYSGDIKSLETESIQR